MPTLESYAPPATASSQAAFSRFHRMPFGAELQDDGRVRFGLWAPAAESLTVCLEGIVVEMRYACIDLFLKHKQDNRFHTHFCMLA